jgi:UDP-glucose 4-epimerase
MSTILVTGGAGYIGTHTCVELLNEGHHVVVADHLGNSHPSALERVREITGRDLVFIQGDIRDREVLERAFSIGIDAVIHFAGSKAVGESVAHPLMYYRNNLDSTLSLCEAMETHGVRRMVFSSSATVYRTPALMPVGEDAPLWSACPYGWTKFMNEQILRDVYVSNPDWSILLLRYFNPAGAHPSGRIGEDPNGIPNNLLPYITQVAVGRLPYLTVFGDDYPTPDGTGIRDYIHVVDLAKGHCRAVDHVLASTGVDALNLGTGSGCSVFQLVAAFEAATGIQVPCRIGPRRPGDVAECYADPARAQRTLGWQAKIGIEDMCRDAWRWQSANPGGYAGPGAF